MLSPRWPEQTSCWQVATLSETAQDKQVQASGAILSVPHPDGPEHGDTRVVAAPFEISGAGVEASAQVRPLAVVCSACLAADLPLGFRAGALRLLASAVLVIIKGNIEVSYPRESCSWKGGARTRRAAGTGSRELRGVPSQRRGAALARRAGRPAHIAARLRPAPHIGAGALLLAGAGQACTLCQETALLTNSSCLEFGARRFLLLDSCKLDLLQRPSGNSL